MVVNFRLWFSVVEKLNTWTEVEGKDMPKAGQIRKKDKSIPSSVEVGTSTTQISDSLFLPVSRVFDRCGFPEAQKLALASVVALYEYHMRCDFEIASYESIEEAKKDAKESDESILAYIPKQKNQSLYKAKTGWFFIDEESHKIIPLEVEQNVASAQELESDESKDRKHELRALIRKKLFDYEHDQTVASLSYGQQEKLVQYLGQTFSGLRVHGRIAPETIFWNGNTVLLRFPGYEHLISGDPSATEGKEEGVPEGEQVTKVQLDGETEELDDSAPVRLVDTIGRRSADRRLEVPHLTRSAPATPVTIRKGLSSSPSSSPLRVSSFRSSYDLRAVDGAQRDVHGFISSQNLQGSASQQSRSALKKSSSFDGRSTLFGSGKGRHKSAALPSSPSQGKLSDLSGRRPSEHNLLRIALGLDQDPRPTIATDVASLGEILHKLFTGAELKPLQPIIAGEVKEKEEGNVVVSLDEKNDDALQRQFAEELGSGLVTDVTMRLKLLDQKMESDSAVSVLAGIKRYFGSDPAVSAGIFSVDATAWGISTLLGVRLTDKVILPLIMGVWDKHNPMWKDSFSSVASSGAAPSAVAVNAASGAIVPGVVLDTSLGDSPNTFSKAASSVACTPTSIPPHKAKQTVAKPPSWLSRFGKKWKSFSTPTKAAIICSVVFPPVAPIAWLIAGGIALAKKAKRTIATKKGRPIVTGEGQENYAFSIIMGGDYKCPLTIASTVADFDRRLLVVESQAKSATDAQAPRPKPYSHFAPQ